MKNVNPSVRKGNQSKQKENNGRAGIMVEQDGRRKLSAKGHPNWSGYLQ